MTEQTQIQEAPKQVKNVAGFIQQVLAISKRVTKAGEAKGQNEKVGDVIYFVPELAAFDITADVEEIDEDGLPIYKSEKANWVYGCILAAVKANVRSKLVSGTASFKEGLAAPFDLTTLMAEGERGGSGEALKKLAALKKNWAEHVDSLKKSAAATKMLKGFFASPDNLALQPQENRTKFQSYLMEYLGKQTEDFLVANQRYLDNLLAACKTAAEADDF